MILESKRLDWVQSVRIAIDVLKALEYAHGRGVVHRDMKPSNVLVRAHDHMATVMDFGIAKMTTSTKLTATGQTMGTVRYMSPEQVRGQEVDLRTDIYSLGATLYESLVGDTPFDGSTHFEIMTKHLSEAPKRPSALGVEMPQRVEDALMRSLAKRADRSVRDARATCGSMLEAALREGDVGLSETQRLGGEVLARSAPRRRRAARRRDRRPASPTSSSRRRSRPRRSRRRAAPHGALRRARAASCSAAAASPRTSTLLQQAPRVRVGREDPRRHAHRRASSSGRCSSRPTARSSPTRSTPPTPTAAKALLDSSPELATVKARGHRPHRRDPAAATCAIRACSPATSPRDCATAKSEVTFGKDGKHLLLVANQAGALASSHAVRPRAGGVRLPAGRPRPTSDAICDADEEVCGRPIRPLAIDILAKGHE